MLAAQGTDHNAALPLIELGMTAIAFAASFAWPRLGSALFTRIERMFRRLARRQGLAVLLVGSSVFLLRLAILPLYPIPLPFVPDDFSFLLAADTFAHGRLANPTPAMWIHFESMHISMQPTYMSMYFPAQGLLLAAGKVFLGHPWFGALIASALMCSAICWMLQAWLPPSWALLGGFIAVLRIALFSYWTNTYHASGSLTALAGALVLGALPRLTRTAQSRYGLIMGVGIVMLVLSRPYEGLLLCIPVGVALGHWALFGKNRPSPQVLLRKAAAPLAIILAGIAWLGYYDYRAFGSPTTLPYTVNRAQYALAPYYVWQSQRPEPSYRFEVMRRFYHKEELEFFTKIHSPAGFIPQTFLKGLLTFEFYAGFILLLPLIMIHRVFRDRRIRFLVACVLVMTAGLLIEIYLLPHYVALVACAFYAIGLQCLRHLRFWKPGGQTVGLTLVRLIVTVCVVLAGIRMYAQPLHIAAPEWPPSSWNFTWFGPEHYGVERARVEAQLGQLPGGQLAIVRYAPDHQLFDEWVYNSADIDGSKVVWAREMDETNNLKLIEYYGSRKAWLVEPDAVPARVTPFSIPAVSTTALH
jgi:hypothetical protein